MANTDKQNFRCDTQTRWLPFKGRLEVIAKEYEFPPATEGSKGRPVDMTSVLVAEVERVLDETPEQTAQRLGLRRKARA